MNSPFSNRDTGRKVCLWDRRALDVGCSVAVSALGWVSVVQGESCLMRSQSGGGETLFFSARLLCLQEIQKVAFILQSEANIALFRVS